jgi:6-phosphogluconolactonase
MNYSLLSSTTEQEFVTQSVTWLTAAIKAAIADHGECIIGLSGGSTPKAVYTELAKVTGIDWARVTFFLVDDRLVPADHADSNQKLLADTLLAAGTIVIDQCIVPDTSKGAANAVAQYTKALTALFATTPPDIIVLGMGNDGHIASLFPPVPEAAFGQTLATHTQTDVFAVRDRI